MFLVLTKQNHSTEELRVLKKKVATYFKHHKAGQAQLLSERPREKEPVFNGKVLHYLSPNKQWNFSKYLRYKEWGMQKEMGQWQRLSQSRRQTERQNRGRNKWRSWLKAAQGQGLSWEEEGELQDKTVRGKGDGGLEEETDGERIPIKKILVYCKYHKYHSERLSWQSI